MCGERLFVGLFTSAAYNQSAAGDSRCCAARCAGSCSAPGSAEASHDGKALMHILDTYPRDELFQIGEDDLFEIALGILHLQERQRVALFMRRDPFERFVSCLIYVPRDAYDTDLRHRFQKILAQRVRRACGRPSTTQMTESPAGAAARDRADQAGRDPERRPRRRSRPG